MKCFIHSAKEAVAACRRCGKGMCDDCSAYSGHSGICPECRRKEFIKEIHNKENAQREKRRETIRTIVISSIIAVIILAAGIAMATIDLIMLWIALAVIAVYALTVVFKVRKLVKERKKLLDRIAKLQAEVERLNKILHTTGGEEFV